MLDQPTVTVKSFKPNIGEVKRLLSHPLITGYAPPIAAVLIAILLVLVLIYPNFNNISAIKTDQSLLQQLLTTLTEKIATLESFAGNATVLDSEYLLFNRAVPSEDNIPTLLTQMQEICTLSSVTITAMQFSSGTAGTTGTAEETGEAVAVPSYTEVRVKLSVSGKYAKITGLLRNLEKASRVIDVESVSFSAATGESETAGVLTAELTLVAYYTPTPTITPSTPVTFSFTDPAYTRNSQGLQLLTPYKTDVTVEEEAPTE